MSTISIQSKFDETPLDGPNDLRPEVKTSFIAAKEAAIKAAKAKAKSAKKK